MVHLRLSVWARLVESVHRPARGRASAGPMGPRACGVGTSDCTHRLRAHNRPVAARAGAEDETRAPGERWSRAPGRWSIADVGKPNRDVDSGDGENSRPRPLPAPERGL